MQARSVSGTWVRGLLDAMAGQGLDVDALCRSVGLDPQSLVNTDAGCPTETLSALWDEAVLRSGDPAIGLVTRHTAQPACFDVVGYIMMSSPTLLAGLQRLQHFLRLIADDHTVELKSVGEVTHATLAIGGGNRAVPRARYESSFLILLTFCRWMMGRDLQVQAMQFTYPPVADTSVYDTAFRCKVEFGARANTIVLSTAELNTPLATSNPVLLEMLNKLAGERMQQIGTNDESTSAKVSALIRRMLPDGEPVRAAIADLLHVSERTLQRLLTKEGTSFQQLLDDTRRELAERYLAQPQVTLGETSYLLGFAEQSIFTRACKRWFQVSPGQIRARLTSGAALAA